MRFAWLRKKQGLEDPKMSTGARLIYIGYNVIWWLPVGWSSSVSGRTEPVLSGSLLSLSSELSPFCIATTCCPSKPHSDSRFVRRRCRSALFQVRSVIALDLAICVAAHTAGLRGRG